LFREKDGKIEKHQSVLNSVNHLDLAMDFGVSLWTQIYNGVTDLGFRSYVVYGW